MNRLLGPLAVVALVACSSPTSNQTPDAGTPPPPPLANAQQGDPGLGSVQQIDFGPGGLLAIGDGSKNRVVVVATGDTKATDAAANELQPIADLRGRIASALGGGAATAIVISDMVVNPISKKLYIAAKRQQTSYLLTVKGAGEVELVDLTNVKYGAVTYAGASAGSTVVDLAWTSDGIVLSGMSQTWTSSTVVTIDNAPFTHEATSNLTTTRSYHRTHTAWETAAPLDRFLPVTIGGATYIAGGYTCAPITRFKVADLKAGATQTTGQTPFDLGPGKQVRDLLAYEKDGRSYLLFVLRSGFSTDFAARVDRSLLEQSTSLDTDAPILFDTDSIPLDPAATHQAAFDDVVRMTKLDDLRAVVLRVSGKLEVADLP